MKRVLLCLLVLGGGVVNASFAGQPGEPSADEAAIRKADEAYVQAFNKHDAKALADAWSPEAVYLNRVTGAEVVGRAAIAEQFTALFKDQPEVKLDLSVQSIQFVSPNVAVEQGIAKTLAPKAEPEEIEYSAVFVRRDGQWLLDRVTDKAKEAAPSRYEQLKPLEWMIGHWVDKDDKVDIETECQWTKNQSFITRSFTVAVRGPNQHVRHADHRLGSGCQDHPVMDVRLRRRLCRSHLDLQERSLVHPEQGHPGRWPKGLDGQRHQAGEPEFVHLADGRADGRGRIAPEHQ